MNRSWAITIAVFAFVFAFCSQDEFVMSLETDKQAESVAEPMPVVMERISPMVMDGGRFVQMERAEPDALLRLQFHVKEKNTDTLQEILADTSNPKSANYGKRMSKAEIDAMTANPEGRELVKDYIGKLGGTILEETSNGLHITASAPTRLWETALHCVFHTYMRIGDNEKFIRTPEYSLPVQVAQQVTRVLNTVQLPYPLNIRGGPTIVREPH